jgi:Recombination, repair and ssDNA binding protein UvsY
MNLYTQEEVDRINKSKEANDKLEEYFNTKRDEWNKNIEPLFEVLKNNFTIEKKDNIIEVSSLALSYRQNINEQISFYLNRRSREDVKIKKLRQDKFVFYATGFGLKTNLGEKAMLIDAHIAENDRTIQLIEVHVEFLRSCSKNLETLGFTIKNIIELMNYLGR